MTHMTGQSIAGSKYFRIPALIEKAKKRTKLSNPTKGPRRRYLMKQVHEIHVEGYHMLG